MKIYVKGGITGGLIGMWWITDNYEVLGVKCTPDEGEIEDGGSYKHYPNKYNHSNLWKSTCKDNQEMYNLGYKGVERGRVIYSIKTASYEVTCSEAIRNDAKAREAIMDFFELHGCSVDFVALNHYQILPLTGNPAVDSLNYPI